MTFIIELQRREIRGRERKGEDVHESAMSRESNLRPPLEDKSHLARMNVNTMSKHGQSVTDLVHVTWSSNTYYLRNVKWDRYCKNIIQES